ncbi:MAG: hypothetical protein ACE5FG_15345, partial [Myxococcota bacterium]
FRMPSIGQPNNRTERPALRAATDARSVGRREVFGNARRTCPMGGPRTIDQAEAKRGSGDYGIYQFYGHHPA